MGFKSLLPPWTLTRYLDVQLQSTKRLLGIQSEVYCINRAGRQLFPQGRCTERGNSRSFHRDWTVGLLYSPSTSKCCQTCQKPAASKRPCVGSRALSMVLTTKCGTAGKEPLGNFDQDSPTVSSDTLAHCFCSLVCFEHLSQGRARGELAGWLLAPWRRCAVPKPPPRTPLRETSCGTRPVPGAWPRPTCCLSGQIHPGVLVCLALRGSQGEGCFWVSVVHRLCPLTCVSHAEKASPLSFTIFQTCVSAVF